MDGYNKAFQKNEKEWEALCIRCGGCCGAFDDPCKHLRKGSDGKFFCEIYDHRFGVRESVKGEKFDCVHITKILDVPWKNDHLCVYKKLKKMPWLNVKK
ncbi:MAG: hypothetical protein PHP69_04985 [Candidatus Omnitrophica bacterium]|nr:hypothetical protein [Candidatus Omnitrophota bacterium]MDD5080377.1 hypothetical protein [Candidatus Omnitrophota bacterium]MDD5440886.1 hypothetical protein [Candidatus Omnitrophota bacterium]